MAHVHSCRECFWYLSCDGPPILSHVIPSTRLAQGSALPSHLLILFHYAAVTKAILLLFAAAVVAPFVRAPRPNGHPPPYTHPTAAKLETEDCIDKHTTSEKYEEIRHYASVLRTHRRFGGARDDDDEEESIGTVIGIDLGTTYSCVGVYKNGKVEIIANDQGNRITPSYVAWSDEGERLIGDAAKNQATINPENTVFDVKRLIGRKYTDKTVKADKKLFPFELVDKDGKPYVRVDVSGERKHLHQKKSAP